jgi:hypothetical protein
MLHPVIVMIFVRSTSARKGAEATAFLTLKLLTIRGLSLSRRIK